MLLPPRNAATRTDMPGAAMLSGKAGFAVTAVGSLRRLGSAVSGPADLRVNPVWLSLLEKAVEVNMVALEADGMDGILMGMIRIECDKDQTI